MASMGEESGVVVALRSLSPDDVRAAVEGFSVGYVNDWDWWLTVPEPRRPHVFGQILRRWQATRPLAMRRTRAEASHDPPYLDDLYAAAQDPIHVLGDLNVSNISLRSSTQDRALRALWDDFSRLPVNGKASCVGITKAVLLMTNGRIGPAFDSQVRERLALPRPTTSAEWLSRLEQISDDITAFETTHGSLQAVVPRRFSHLATGRLYDMTLGPRGSG